MQTVPYLIGLLSNLSAHKKESSNSILKDTSLLLSLLIKSVNSDSVINEEQAVILRDAINEAVANPKGSFRSKAIFLATWLNTCR